MLSLLCPPGNCCSVCGMTGEALTDSLCSTCRRNLIDRGPRCRVCRRRFAPSAATAITATTDPRPRIPIVCRRCRILPPPFLGVTTIGLYDGLLRWSIGRLKGATETWLARPLGGCLAEAVAADGIQVDLVVPVPAEPRRLRRRGYNPPQLLAAAVSQHLRVPLYEALSRNPGPPQARLGQRERWLAATHGYRRRRAGWAHSRLAGTRVLLVDDVITTGATLSACTFALLQAGAALVWCGAAADAPAGSSRRSQGIDPA